MLKKLCLLSWSLSLSLLASEQLIVVVAKNFDTSTAQLQRYEQSDNRYKKVGKTIPVNLGRNGLGWGLGHPFKHAEGEPLKHEGDGKAPAGIFDLSHVFGYAPSAPTAMPYLQSGHDLICIDDTSSPFYNTLQPITDKTEIKSFEWMRRDDALYELGVTVDHNVKGVKPRGSCIFMHVEKAPGSPTAGCTSMTLPRLKTVVGWLDSGKKPLLIQIPKAYCETIEKQYPGVSCP
jgi:D-alanyl-D-alanine dipeptidase